MSIPIFVLGNPRSGSSAMSSCLRNILNIQGYHEGHFLKYILQYKNITDKIFNNLSIHESNKKIAIGNIDKKLFYNNVILSFKTTYESLFDSSQPYWMDKTPGNFIDLIYTINNLWPNSKFIFLKRRSLENVSSRLKKFTNLSFDTHCEQWSSLMDSWYFLDKEIIRDRFIEIEHYDLLFNLEKVSNDLIKLLPEYYDKKQNIINFLNTTYPESTTCKRPTLLDINTIDWSTSQKDTHYKICSQTLNLYNYSLDLNYFSR
jgi:hypothetical protein